MAAMALTPFSGTLECAARPRVTIFVLTRPLLAGQTLRLVGSPMMPWSAMRPPRPIALEPSIWYSSSTMPQRMRVPARRVPVARSARAAPR